MTDLPLGKTTVSYSGSAVTYTVTAAGRLTAKLWGAGGSGALEKGTLYGTLPGGAGGFTTIVLDVQVGDTIEVRTAQGGQLGSVTTGTVSGSLTGVGGLGGYPDGGNGGPDPYAMPGGGGGGSRLYVNGTLVAVAGGGGGQGLGVAAQNPGNGGGSSGTAGINTANGGSTGGVTPGSQVAGGVNSARTSDTTTSGSSLRGGHGYVAGTDQNFNYTTNSPNGGGGGGGYYGGGGGGQALSYVNGGSGGSGYINTGHARYVSGSTTAGASLVPAGTTDVDYPGSSIGYGGASGFSGSAQPGYNGAVILDFPILTAGNYAVSFTGARKTYQAASDGVITVKLWGAAGGSYATTDPTNQANWRGGGGGFTTFQATVSAGDFVHIDVGGGGQRNDVRSGGWPNGGTGGLSNTNNVYNGSGGGGSTALYINSTLIAVAGAGGGTQASGFGNGVVRGGAGGGDPSGTAVSVTTGATNRGGGPGTQSAGGAGGSGSTGRGGSSMQGGNGHDGSVNTGLANPGAGGGGGYYGGGGGNGNSSSAEGPGGSGSGYLNTADGHFVAASGTTTAGSGVTGAGQGDVNYPGSVGSSLANSGGQSGAAWFSFADANVPANTSGAVGTVTVSAAAGSATGGGGASGTVGTLTLTAPEPTVQVTAFANGDVGTITLTPGEAGFAAAAEAAGDLGTITLTPAEALPTTNALVIVPINDDVELPLTAPEGDATGEFTPIEITLPGPLVFHAPLGDGTVPIDVSGDIGTITLTAIQGEATEAVFGSGDIGTVVISEVNAEAVGYAQAVGETVGEGPDRVLALIGMGDFRAPAGHVEILGDATGGINSTLTLTVPEATAQEGVAATGGLATVTLTSPEASASGAVNAVPPREGALDGPYGVYLKIIFFQPPGAPEVTGAVSATPLISTITTSPPRPTTQLGAQLVLALPRRLEIRAPIGHGALTGEVFAGGDLDTLDLIPPEASVLIDDSSADVEAIGDMPILTFAPVEGSGSAPAAAVASLPSLYLTAPDAYVETLDDEGHLPPTFAPLRFRRTRVVGRAPVSLVEREIALNEADGVLFSRDAQGQIAETPYADLAAGRFAADGGTEGQVLDASGAWIDFDPAYETEVRLPAPTATRIRLSEGLLAEENTAPVKNRVYYRPFFVSQTLSAVDLAVEVVTPASGTAWMGVCAWNLDGSPGDVIVWGSASTASAGLARHIEPFQLPTGWYAAMFALSGSGSPIFSASAAPRAVDDDFMPLGDLTAPFSGSLDPAPGPNDQADEAFAYVTLETADG